MTARELKNILTAIPDDTIIATGPQLRVVGRAMMVAGTLMVDQSGHEEKSRSVTILEVM